MEKTAAPPDHAALADGYAAAVIDGSVLAGPWVRAAARRHLSDCEKSKAAKYKYVFDPAVGARVCRFIEQLQHTKGQWAAKKEYIKLQPWQCFLAVVLFGWLRKSTGKRRFRSVYWEIPRKNGKSLLAAAIGLYMLIADGEFGAEVYSGATTEKQAWEVFRPAKLMIERSERIRAKLGVQAWAKSIIVPANGSKFEAIIGDPGDGASPSCAVIDEYHEHQSPNLHDTMETGMGAREQPLMLVITTAGYNIAGPCHERHDEVKKVLEGVLENEELFGCIFGIDVLDDWADPKSLIKANPNYGVSVDAEFLLAQQRQAMQSPTQQNKFKTKHLNVWTSVLAGVMNMHQWQLCSDTMLDESELVGCPSWVAVDLASKSDLCAAQRIYRRDSHGKAHYYLFGKYWLPEAAIEEPGPNHAHYTKWVKLGLLTQTDGATVDFEQITEEIIEDCKRVNPREAIFDPFNAVQMMQALTAKNILTVQFIQSPIHFAVPLDELLTAVKDGRLHHDGNDITSWCMSNMVARVGKKGMISPIKQKPHQKIDGAIAAIMAISRAMDTTILPDINDYLNNPISA